MSQVKDESDWIIEQLHTLSDLYRECQEKKVSVLSSFTACLILLLNNLVQISGNSLHNYEKKILVKPMEVFISYYVDQCRIALNTDDLQARKRIIDDVDRAVGRISEVYSNVLNSTANTDRQMFLSMPISVSLYFLPPQLYATCSDLIDSLVEAFEAKQYGFFLNPTITQRLATEVLFKEREQRGKIVVIEIPFNMLDQGNHISLHILHEVFHVLTAEERNRKKRAQKLSVILLKQIMEEVFEDAYTEMAEKWVQEWFQGYRRSVEELMQHSEEDTVFCARSVMGKLGEYLERDVLEIENRFSSIYMDSLENEDDQELREKLIRHETLLDLQFRIKNNVRDILRYNRIHYCLKRMMFLFQETYADVACLTISDITVASYKNAFYESIQYHVDDEGDQFLKDRFRILRESLVAAVMDLEEEMEDEEVTRRLREAYHIYKENMERLSHVEKQTGRIPVGEEPAAATQTIYVNESLYNAYGEYLWDCRKRLLRRKKSAQRTDAWKSFQRVLEQLE